MSKNNKATKEKKEDETRPLSGKRLKIARDIKDIKQLEFMENLTGEKIIIKDVGTIKRWEKNGIPDNRLEYVADFFSVGVDAFIDESIREEDFKKIINDPTKIHEIQRSPNIEEIISQLVKNEYFLKEIAKRISDSGILLAAMGASAGLSLGSFGRTVTRFLVDSKTGYLSKKKVILKLISSEKKFFSQNDIKQKFKDLNYYPRYMIIIEPIIIISEKEDLDSQETNYYENMINNKFRNFYNLINENKNSSLEKDLFAIFCYSVPKFEKSNVISAMSKCHINQYEMILNNKLATFIFHPNSSVIN